MSSTKRFAMLVAAALCVAVSAIHVDDQGGVTAFADPDWLGWAYRLLEVGALVVAGALVFAAGARWTAARTRLTWLVAALVGAGPFVGYVLTRTTGLPGATDDIGNWGEPLGVVSLVVEAVLVLVAVAGIAATRTATVPSRTATRPAPTNVRTAA